MGNRGPLSEEWKQKIRESTSGPKNHFYGKHHTEATKQKMREKRKGIYCKEKHPMWGKHPSEETRRKWSEQRKGRKLTEEWKQHIREGTLGEKHHLYGKHQSEEVKQKISKRKKELGHSKGEKNPMFGKHHTEETKQKIRGIHLGTHLSEEHKQKIKKRMNENHPMLGRTGEKSPLWGRHLSEETKRKISESEKGNKNHMWGKKHSKETIKKFTKNMIPNGNEIYLDYLLQNHFPDEWKYVGDGQKIIKGLCPDFINVNGKQQIIELFGKHWHTGENLKFHQTAKGREKIFADNGYNLLIIWDYELKDDMNLIKKIDKFTKS